METMCDLSSPRSQPTTYKSHRHISFEIRDSAERDVRRYVQSNTKKASI